MRKLFLAIMTVVSIVLFNACEETADPCKNVTCSSHGTPTEVLGACSCDCDATTTSGYYGNDCENYLNCLNGGTFSSGTCACAAGYEGDSCQTVSRNKFIGNFSATDNCTSAPYSVEIVTSSTGIDKILIKNFGKYLCSGAAPDVVATVTGSTFTIASQTFCPGNEFTIDEGSGTLSTDQITITVSYKTTFTTQETCTAVLTRQ